MPQPPIAAEDARILLAGARTESLHKFQSVLAGAGFRTVLTAAGLETAKASVLADRPDLILVRVERGNFFDELLFRDLEALPRERFVAVLIIDSETPLEDVVERARVIPATRLAYRHLSDAKRRAEFEAQQCALRYDEALAVLKKAEERLAAELTKSEAENLAKSEFIANLSHELRTPLNAVIGFSDIMMNESFGPMGSPKYKEYAGDIQKAGHCLLTLINDILDMSRAEVGQLTLNLEPVDVRETINDAVRMFHEKARKKGVALSTEFAPDFPRLRTDERRLRQVLLNLISNAVKFTAAGGTVAVKGGVDPVNGAFVLVVSDNGVGIDMADLEKIMDRYGDVRNTRTGLEPGTGLGLPLTQRIAEALGAKFELRSTRKIGTAVTLRFPPELIVRDGEDIAEPEPLRARAS
jgi:signal transduction histidine kinase